MKKTLLFFIAFLAVMNFSFALSDGDIAFVSYNSDGTNDYFSFVAMDNIPEGTQITFTDNGWLSSGAFRTGEGYVTWTSPEGGIGCGSVVTFNGLALSTGGDQIFAFQGASSNPTFLAAINFDGSSWASGGASSSNDSGLPSGLTTEIAIQEVDNAIYTGTTTVGAPSTLLSAVLDSDNWTGDNSNNADYTGSFDVTGCVPLSVDLIFFEAIEERESQSISLSWQTASEENNSHFEVEHSTNNRDFQTLDKVIGNGTSAEIQNYSFTHEEAVTGKNYYRLRQVDFDGAFEYSDMVVVEIKGGAQVEVRPTLATDQVTFAFGTTTRQSGQVQIFDIAGRQVSAIQIASGTEQMELSVVDFEKGIYFVQLQLNGEMTTVKFVKQ